MRSIRRWNVLPLGALLGTIGYALLIGGDACGRSSSVEWKLPKLQRRVRLPSPAPYEKQRGLVLVVFHIVTVGDGSRTREG